MRPISQDEKQLVLAGIIRELEKTRAAAKRTEFDMLAFLQAQDEARSQLERLESEFFPEDG